MFRTTRETAVLIEGVRLPGSSLERVNLVLQLLPRPSANSEGNYRKIRDIMVTSPEATPAKTNISFMKSSRVSFTSLMTKPGALSAMYFTKYCRSKLMGRSDDILGRGCKTRRGISGCRRPADLVLCPFR